MSDINFEQMLAQYNQDYREAEEFGSDWFPPDGEYIATVLAVKKGVSTKGDKPMLWWKVTGRIEDQGDEKIHGKEFPIGFYRSSSMGILKGQVRALNGGEPVGNLNEVDAVLENVVGAVIRVNVKTSVSKKDGREYTNCYVLEVLATEDVAEPPQE